ncbi:type II toxin-antitoxin system HipA family toxin [Cupriavidus pauculus]|uniref:Type II toxin-antitoxin system HipA family toxin n=1 Tax=Cupriavidus pauculus TaxID=82633 RepID=A0A3G8HA27_9BURK|nr:HipA domain-containing protein [Cupriavidus pauculus]AZG17266.1 type II toxin-antitoxin system HipA family toxin [Cupriavidus pauculus]
MNGVPVWAWLPGEDSPTHAADLTLEGTPRFVYSRDYLSRDDAVPLDPVELRLVRNARGIAIAAADGLPGVIRDAKPAGYGADRLMAHAGKELTPFELLERGVPDGVGAIEVCTEIERKLAWKPKGLEELQYLAEELDAADPASRALRRLNADLDTSAGGERPKATLVHDGRLWLAKMQDRGDRSAMPAREFVAMRLAQMAGLDVAPVVLHTFGSHQVLLVERFDRRGDPYRPQRRLFASAHTVLRLPLDAVRGDPRRSYLNFGDALRVWAKGRDDLARQLEELWRRMVFNALVGNTDDHPLNHGLIHEGGVKRSWRLAPAFDITPVMSARQPGGADAPVLSMATGADGLARASVERLSSAASHFGIDREAAMSWISLTARLVAEHWETMLRQAAKPILGTGPNLDSLIADAHSAFAYSERLSSASNGRL